MCDKIDGEVSFSFRDRQIKSMIIVRLADALYNSSVLTDCYFADFCTMLLNMKQITNEDIVAVEKSTDYPQGSMLLWCDGSSLPPEGVVRQNVMISMLRELEYIFQIAP